MAGVVGFSVGDVLTFGRICYSVHKTCFSETAGANKAWRDLGSDVTTLGLSLNKLAGDEKLFPPDTEEAEEESLHAVRMVVGDFRETLNELRTFLKKYQILSESNAPLWKKIRWSTEQRTVESFKERIAIHIRGINMVMNPLMLESVRNTEYNTNYIQHSVRGIENRMDGIGNVLQALLTVASTQLQIGTSTQYRLLEGPVPSQRRLTDVSHSPSSNPTITFTNNDGRLADPLSRAWVRQNLSESAAVFQESTVLGYNNNDGPVGLTWPVNHAPNNVMQSQQPAVPLRTELADSPSYPTSTSAGRDGLHPVLPAEMLGSRVATMSLDRDGPNRNDSQLLFELPANPLDASGPNTEDPILARMAEQARRDQHGEKHAIEHFIQAAFFFYLKACEELETIPERISKDAYLSLVKASWIVHDFLARLKGQGHTLPTNIEKNIQVLSSGILRQFQKLKDRPRTLPDLTNLDSSDFKIFPDELELVAEPHHPLPDDIEKIAIISRTESLAYRSRPPIPRKPVKPLVHVAGPQREAFFAPSFSPDRVIPVELDAFSPTDQTFRRYESPRNSTTTSVFTPIANSRQPSMHPDEAERTSYGPRSASTSTSSEFRGVQYEARHPSRQNSNATTAPPGYGETSNSGQLLPPTPPESIEDDEQPGEQTAFKYMSVLWAGSYSASYEDGHLSVFWNSVHGFFRIVTTWNFQNRPRSKTHDIDIRGTDLVADYAYEDNAVIYFRRTNPKLVDQTRRDTMPEISDSSDESRVGFIYKFRNFQDMLQFQGAFTRETIYQDLIKRISTVKIKKAGERGGLTMGFARVQLWHEQEASGSTFSDTATLATGISPTTMRKMALEWSRLVIFFGPSFQYLFCYVTDDIDLNVNISERTVELRPRRYSITGLLRSPKSVKAKMIGNDTRKGGIRLDKYKISPDDQQSFDDYLYIRLCFRETPYLTTFVGLWEKMMTSRRVRRAEIAEIKARHQERAAVAMTNT